MDYIEVNFIIEPFEEYISDVLASELGEIGFDSFVPSEVGMDAYILQSKFDESELKNLLSDFPFEASIDYKITPIKSKNWNEEWEKHYFEPIVIGNDCVIHSSFHKDVPKAKYDIVIDPKMAFGTGHHQTTALMMEFMLEEDFSNKLVLDMGCGTGILAILASKLGAKETLAIDYDEICFDSTIENSELNSTPNIKALLGSKEVIPDLKFDIILANINRNILLDQLDRYAEVASPGGLLFLSGFYENPDLDILKQKCESIGFHYLQHKELNNWVAVKFMYKV